MSKKNIYVNSKNRKSDESPSNFSVIIPDDLLKINKDEYFTLSVNSFYCYNDFYQCNSNSNYFTLIFRNNSNVVYLTQKLYLNVGNPDVYNLLSDFNSKLSAYLTCAYDNIRNKITYTRMYAQRTNYFNMYINAVNSGCFLD